MKIKIQSDNITEMICKNFTIEHNGEIEFKEHIIPNNMIPVDFSIGLIIGKSGSGKTTLLSNFGDQKGFKWEGNKAIASHFNSYKEAEECLMGAGLASIPSWLKPYSVLSNGEKHRADLAITISSDMVIDEFVSYVDDNAAMGLANSIQRYIRKKDYKNIVFASLNKNLVQYLRPDWVYDTDNSTLTVNSEVYDFTYDSDNPIKVEYKKRKHFMKIK